MKLEHIALTVKIREEINDFYCKILEMNRVRDFVLKRDVAFDLFGRDEQIEVAFLEKDGISMEIFVTETQAGSRVEHLCIAVTDREQLTRSAREMGYGVIRIKRPEFDLLFLKDKSGNLFELRNTR